MTLPTAQAGNINFGLSLTDNKIAITNQGNATAFYPAAYRLDANGHWQPLALPNGTSQPAELVPSATLSLTWPDTRPLTSLPPLEALQPVMVRFFDQAGAGFGQISFFHQPLGAEQTLDASYQDGKMTIAPPAGKTDNPDHQIRATWLLWGQEEGIRPLRAPVEPRHVQPDARRIVWRADMPAQRFDLGAGLPVVFLVHETAQGLRLQVVGGGGVQGRQQRAAWLDWWREWERGARWLSAAALALLLWHMAQAWRTRSAT
ncbi:MAG: hypothetical protein JSS58_08785 [Proteobacteria bacterium]|nr:hypothetical protein [Pseudomonadota bacterium]